MDVNEYMKRSIELQEAILAELKRLSGLGIKSGGQVVADEVARAQTEDAKPKATEHKPNPASGSTKQAANHAKDDEPPFDKGEKKLTADDVRAALMDLGKAQGSEAAIALLKQHGATAVSGLAKDAYEQVIADARAAARGE